MAVAFAPFTRVLRCFLARLLRGQGELSVATTQSKLSELLPGFPVVEETPTMHVRKRNGFSGAC